MAPKKLVEDPPAAVVEDFDDKDHRNSRYFWIINTGAVCVALYLIAYDFIPDPSNPFSPIFSVIIIYLLAQLVIPAYAFFIAWAPKPDLVASESGLDLYTRADERLLRQTMVDDMHQMTEAAMKIKRRPVLGEDHTIFEAMRTLDFWILLVSILYGVGTGLEVMNNMGQIGLAMGYVDISIFDSLTSIWEFFIRVSLR
ncbi:hypothetical protein ACFX15_006205 [Malus domestica]